MSPAGAFLAEALERAEREIPAHEVELLQHIENQKGELFKYQADDVQGTGVAMSSAVLEAAQNVAQQLQELQFVYIKENMKQGKAIEEIAVANKSWGQFAVFDTLLSKLRGEVNSEAEAIKTGKAPKKSRMTLMNERADAEWQGLLNNNRMKKKTLGQQMEAEELRLHHAAKKIQKHWRVYTTKKEELLGIKADFLRGKKVAKEELHQNATEGVRQGRQLAMRNANQRRQLGYNSESEDGYSSAGSEGRGPAVEREEPQGLEFDTSPAVQRKAASPAKPGFRQPPQDSPRLPLIPTTQGESPITPKPRGMWAPQDAQTPKLKSARKLRAKTTKRLDRLSRPVVRTQHLVKEEAEGRAEALRRARTAAAMANLASPLAGMSTASSGRPAASASPARWPAVQRASPAAAVPSQKQSSKSTRTLSVTKTPSRRMGMLMRTANAMKLAGMGVPDAIDEEMVDLLAGADDREGTVAEVLRAYSFTDAQFLSQTATHVEEGRVAAWEQQMSERERAMAATPGGAAPGADGEEDGGDGGEGVEHESPEERVLRAARGYEEFDDIVGRWLEGSGVSSVEDLAEDHPDVSTMHMVAALHKMMSDNLHKAQGALALMRKDEGAPWHDGQMSGEAVGSHVVDEAPTAPVGAYGAPTAPYGAVDDALQSAAARSKSVPARISVPMPVPPVLSVDSPAGAESSAKPGGMLMDRRSSNAKALATASALLHVIESKTAEAMSPIGRLRELSNPLQLFLGTTHAVSAFKQELSQLRKKDRRSSLLPTAKSSAAAEVARLAAESDLRRNQSMAAEMAMQGNLAPWADSPEAEELEGEESLSAAAAARSRVTSTPSPAAPATRNSAVGSDRGSSMSRGNALNAGQPSQGARLPGGDHAESQEAGPTTRADGAMAAADAGTEVGRPTEQSRPSSSEATTADRPSSDPAATATATRREPSDAGAVEEREAVLIGTSDTAGGAQRQPASNLGTTSHAAVGGRNQHLAAQSASSAGVEKQPNPGGGAPAEVGTECGQHGSAKSSWRGEARSDGALAELLPRNPLGPWAEPPAGVAGVGVVDPADRPLYSLPEPGAACRHAEARATLAELRASPRGGATTESGAAELPGALTGTSFRSQQQLYSMRAGPSWRAQPPWGSDPGAPRRLSEGAPSLAEDARLTKLGAQQKPNGGELAQLLGASCASRWGAPAGKSRESGKGGALEPVKPAGGRRSSARQAHREAARRVSLTEAPASQADDPAAKRGLFPVDEVAAEWWVSSQELDYSYSRGGSVRSMLDPLAGGILESGKQRQKSAFFTARYRRQVAHAVNMRCVPNAPNAVLSLEPAEALDVAHSTLPVPTGRTDLMLSLPAFDARLHASRGRPSSWRRANPPLAASCPQLDLPATKQAPVPDKAAGGARAASGKGRGDGSLPAIPRHTHTSDRGPGRSGRRHSLDGEEGRPTMPFRYLPQRRHEPSYYSALMARPLGPVGGAPPGGGALQAEVSQLMDPARPRPPGAVRH